MFPFLHPHGLRISVDKMATPSNPINPSVIPANWFDPARVLSSADLTGHAIADQLIAAGMAGTFSAEKSKLFATLGRSIANRTAPVHAAFIPGRIELLGKHTDYCGGRSLLCTVDRGFCMTATPRNDGVIRILDAAKNHAIDFDAHAEHKHPPGHWGGYAQAVVRRLANNFKSAGKLGADIAFISDLPPAAGLSSSSALIIGLIVMLARTNNLASTAAWQKNLRTTEDIAAYAGCIENGGSFGDLPGDRGVGTFGGSQDHTAILCCRTGQISQFRFGPVTREADVIFPGGVKLAVLLSGVVAEKTGAAMAEYNAVSLRARKLVELWNYANDSHLHYLAQVVETPANVEKLTALLNRLPHPERDSLTLRLEQFLQESTQIIPAAAIAIKAADWPLLGELTSKSHGLAVTHLLNQVPATIALQQSAMQSGALAASAFGAGFGGSVWAIFPADLDVALPPGSFVTEPSIPMTVLGR